MWAGTFGLSKEFKYGNIKRHEILQNFDFDGSCRDIEILAAIKPKGLVGNTQQELGQKVIHSTRRFGPVFEIFPVRSRHTLGPIGEHSFHTRVQTSCFLEFFWQKGSGDAELRQIIDTRRHLKVFLINSR